MPTFSLFLKRAAIRASRRVMSLFSATSLLTIPITTSRSAKSPSTLLNTGMVATTVGLLTAEEPAKRLERASALYQLPAARIIDR